MIMKRLKQSTIKRYDARQLRRHLDRLQDKHFHPGRAPYRVDQYQVSQLLGGVVHKPWRTILNRKAIVASDILTLLKPAAYYPFCDLHDRDMIIEAIENTYREVETTQLAMGFTR